MKKMSVYSLALASLLTCQLSLPAQAHWLESSESPALSESLDLDQQLLIPLAADTRSEAPSPWTWVWGIPIPGMGHILLDKPVEGLLILTGTVGSLALGGWLLSQKDANGQTPSLQFWLGQAGLAVGGFTWGYSIMNAYFLNESLSHQVSTHPQWQTTLVKF